MGDFKRSPSKVWWASESLEWREVSESPGSQDSGFSDTDTSPPLPTIQEISKEIYKETRKPENLSANFQEKSTPDKNIDLGQSARKSLFTKHSPKVSRNLFKSVKDGHQYAKSARDTTRSGEAACGADDSFVRREEFLTRSLPLSPKKSILNRSFLNKSAPGVLEEEEEGSFNGNHSLSSDNESELECLFNGVLDSPKHTSTPKAMNKIRHPRNKIPLDVLLKYQQQRLIQTPQIVANDSVQKWMVEIQGLYEQECMTTLQSKSIALELNQKVAHIATYTTTNIKNVLAQSECIELEYKNLNSEKKHMAPLAQSLAGNIMNFFKTYSEPTQKMTNQYDAIRKTNPDQLMTEISQFYTQWETVFHKVILKEVKVLTDKLEKPCSELDLRATVTGITSLCLRNEHLVENFTKNDIIPILLILCEKCEGSSIRTLLLRALSTMCCSAFAVRQFEKYSGIQIINDTLADDLSRPEPERSEAVALLAQVTAPWIEDNHSIKGLQDYSRTLVKSLTKFTSTTRCCQNLLLCAAALANLSTMDCKCIKYMLHMKTVEILLDSVMKRGPCASIYLLEQVATLVANMTSLDVARQHLIQLQTIPALLSFLKSPKVGEDVEKRLQQKSIIALSRLCSSKDASTQVVQLGGVAKLVKMCRDKNERFSSDAVLVAALATLRKIADACGRDIVSVEDAQELVEPKLLDSFLAYSTQSESYV